MNNSTNVKRIMYRLKRQFGAPVEFCLITNSTDYDTGVITSVDKSFTVRRAIILPVKQTRTFDYDLTYIAANNNFVYGGFFDPRERWIVIEAKAIPQDVELDFGWEVIYDNFKYQIKNIIEAEKRYLYLQIQATSMDKVLP